MRANRSAPVPEAQLDLTPEMIRAGADAVLSVIGGADLGGHFSAPALAEEVFAAMDSARRSRRHEPRAHAA
jgi:hypothetical protein